MIGSLVKIANQRKIVTPSSNDVWIKNPAYDENAEMQKQVICSGTNQIQKDKFGNIRILDKEISLGLKRR